MTAAAHAGDAMKSVILVSLNYPPSQMASVHRCRHLARHLKEYGWLPHVITIDERFQKEPTDPALMRVASSEVEVQRVGAIPVWACAPFGVGDLALRSMAHLRQALAARIAARRPDVVFITGWPFYQMLFSRWIQRGLRTPVVLDFQDPWVSAHGAAQPRWSKAGLSHRLGATLEPRAVRHADFVTSVSKIQNDEMAARYPWLDQERMAAIPIGGDPDDFVALRQRPIANATVQLDPAMINLTYVGAFLPRAGNLVRRLFQALRELRDSDPALGARLRLNFIGTSNQPGATRSYYVMPIAAELGVADMVSETPQRVPYLEALSLLANSHGLLLIGSDEPHYTASKIYPALMSGRPYVSLFHSASSAHAILSAAGGGMAHAFADDAALARLTPDLATSLRRLATAPESFGRADPAAYAPYTARAVAQQFARVFDTAAA